jgi:hypothetical protein
MHLKALEHFRGLNNTSGVANADVSGARVLAAV